MLSIKGLHCAVGSPEALVQPRDMAEGDGFMFFFFFFLEVCSKWKKRKGLSSGLTAIGCFLHAMEKKEVIRRFGKCLFWACVCLERPITEREPVFCSAVMAKYGLWA